MTVACFDIGGTNVKAAFISVDKEIRQYQEIKTPETLLELLDFIKTIVSKQPICAISLSVPGAVNQTTGVIKGLSAVPYIHGVSWYTLLEHYHVPIYLENDANCVGISELAVDETSLNYACIVCGTGIGGALIINRQLVKGKKSYSGEFGYMLINRLTNPIKNWSQLASTSSLIRAVAAHPTKQSEIWTGKKIFDCAINGDSVCQEAINTMVQNLAIGIMNIYYCIDPDVIYIGGAISQNALFIEYIQQALDQFVINFPNDFPERPTIKPCTYTKHANLMGAYMNTL